MTHSEQVLSKVQAEVLQSALEAQCKVRGDGGCPVRDGNHGRTVDSLEARGLLRTDVVGAGCRYYLTSAGADVLENISRAERAARSETAPTAEHIEEAERMGEEAAMAAASWIVDGNTSQDHIRRMLGFMADGDPALWDYISAPNLSGQWADDPNPLSLAREITGEDDPSPLVIDTLAETWETAVGQTFEQAAEAELTRWLED